MARRALCWALVLPLVGASVLAGHALAYAATGADRGTVHGYLGHAPQVLALLALIALVALACESRSSWSPAPLPFAALGVGVFALQEHVERVAHGEGVPLLVTERTFLLGVLLQIPVGVVCALIARRLLTTLRTRAPGSGRPPLPALLPLLEAPCRSSVALVPRGKALPVRGPPAAARP